MQEAIRYIQMGLNFFLFFLKERQYVSVVCMVAVVKDCDPGNTIQLCIFDVPVAWIEHCKRSRENWV